MSTYKLTYFDFRGRGEVSRLILVKSGVDFEDNRIEYEQWPSFKEIANLPLGQLPVLEVDEHRIYQSYCIAEFLAKRMGMMGNDEFEEAQIGAIMLTMVDLTRLTFSVCFPDESFITHEPDKEIIRAKVKEQLPTQLGNLEEQVSDSGYFVGNSLTAADLTFFVYIDFIFLIEGVAVNWDKYPKLKGILDNVKCDPNIADYLKNRPQTFV